MTSIQTTCACAGAYTCISTCGGEMLETKIMHTPWSFCVVKTIINFDNTLLTSQIICIWLCKFLLYKIESLMCTVMLCYN